MNDAQNSGLVKGELLLPHGLNGQGRQGGTEMRAILSEEWLFKKKTASPR